MLETSKDIISRLQQQILKMQGFTSPPAGKVKGIGLGPLETAFPNGVFPTGAIHEMVCPTLEQAAATGGLIAGLMGSLMKQGGICLWIGVNRQLFPPSLKNFSVAPHAVIFIDLPQEKDILWVMEQALKCEGLAAVVAEVQEISIVQSRRLQLAVENSRVTGFLLRSNPRKLGANTCVARWQVSPLPSEPGDGLPGVGFPRWQVDLLRVRNGNPGSWQLEWLEGSFVPVADKTEFDMNETRIAG